MTEIGNTISNSEMVLLPHQMKFVEACLSPSSSRVIELQASVGLGKTAALSDLAKRLLRSQPTARVLLLSPAAMRPQFVYALLQNDVNAVLLDRYKFRELLDSSDTRNFWPLGTAFVASLEFVKAPDISEKLASIAWDLVVVDESHRLIGSRAQAVEHFAASANRVVLVTPLDLEDTGVFLSEGSMRMVWRREQIVDHDGKKLGTPVRPTLHKLIVELSAAEIVLQETIDTLSRMFDTDNSLQKLVINSLRRSYQSSPAALDRTLRVLASRNYPDGTDGDSLESVSDEPSVQLGIDTDDSPQKQEILKNIDCSLKELEKVSDDSKLNTFSNLLIDLNKRSDGSSKICVVTEYLATLYYLAADVEDKGITFQLMHGGMKSVERKEVLAKLAADGGILLATWSIMTAGLDLPDFTDLVLYDVPNKKSNLELVLARFDRFGRKEPLCIHVLTPRFSNSFSVAESLNHLSELVLMTNP